MTLRIRRALPLAILTLCLGAFPAAAQASISEFTPVTAGTPAGITAGPDGAVWFTERGTPGAIGRIAADGTITEFVAGQVPGFTAGSEPVDIVAGPDGALWFTEQRPDGAIARFDPETETVTEFTTGLTPQADPTGITVGPDGNLWFTEQLTGRIGRITPQGVITEFSAGLSGFSQPTDIAVGADGKLWFTLQGDSGAIGRIDPGTGAITTFTAGLTPNGAPNSIVAASNGKLYFTETAGSRIGRVKLDGKIEEYSDGLTAGSQPSGIAEGGDGALWFTASNNPGRLGRLWPGSGAIQELTGGLVDGFSVDTGPAGITRGPDGNVWYTQRTLPGIARVTVPPLASIGTPTPAGETTVNLEATIRPNSQATTYRFEYGPDIGYGQQTADAPAGDVAGPVIVRQEVQLTPGVHYHVRVVAVNASGTAVSEDKPFTLTVAGTVIKEKPKSDGTSSVIVPPPAIVPTPGAGQAAELPPPAAPVLGETVSVARKHGTVRVKPRGADHFLPLQAGASIGVGSLVDARNGTVELRSARDREGRAQKGNFWGAIFQVRQRRDGRGMTNLILRGGRFARCPGTATGARARVSGATRDVGRRSVVRRLWGRDRHARFRTHGRDSVATVRGTVWATVDRCDGTLTRVKEGKVLVRDLRRKRSVLLGAGRSYLARHAR